MRAVSEGGEQDGCLLAGAVCVPPKLVGALVEQELAVSPYSNLLLMEA